MKTMSVHNWGFFIFVGVLFLLIVGVPVTDSVAHQGDVGEGVEGPTDFLAMWQRLDGH